MLDPRGPLLLLAPSPARAEPAFVCAGMLLPGGMMPMGAMFPSGMVMQPRYR